MANKDAPFGFRPWGVVLRQRVYKVATAPAIHICIGDMVEGDNQSGVTGKWGLLPIIKDDVVIASGDGATFKKLGVVLSLMDENKDPIQYIDVGRVGDGVVAGYAMVADDPAQLFVAQGDTAFAAADMELNYDITVTALNQPNTLTGLSQMEIAIAGCVVTATFPLRLYAQSHPDEDTYAAVGCRMVCSINPDCHQYGTGTPV